MCYNYNVNKKIKNSIKKFLVITILFVVCYILFACENPMMVQVLEPKTITFNSNGGSPVPSQNLIKGEYVKKPADPQKADFSFLGWFQDNEVFSLEWDFEKIPRKDITLYAKWSDPAGTDIIDIAVTGPMTGKVPVTTASVTGNYIVDKVSWSPNDSVFKGNTSYTVTVTVKSNDGSIFSGSIGATINGYKALVTQNNGFMITVVYAFAPTSAQPLSGISMKTPPEKLEYTHGDTLDLSGLVVTLIYEDDSTEEVTLEKFAAKGITTNPANGTVLSSSTHNGKPVEVSLDSYSVNTEKLTVKKAVAQIGSGDSTVFYENLKDAINAASGTVNNPTVITILADITSDTGYIIDGKHIKLIPEAGQSFTITLSGNSELFNVGTNSTTSPSSSLNLDGGIGTLTLNGGNPNNQLGYHGINVNLSGTLEMNNNVIITGFKGGGVILYDGKFTMNGGEITGNTAINGGGVYMENGTFTMNGGKISGNSAESGGGVCVIDGTFKISNGIIYGTDEPENQNKAPSGAAVYKTGGTAEYGVFNSGNWFSNGNLTPGNDTIEVEDGKLIRPD
jgi:uncharacterized repeat protein (TIGR02543 family)